MATGKRMVAGLLAHSFGCLFGCPSLLGSSLYLDLGLRGRDPERTIWTIGHEEATATHPTIDRRCQW
jgi:hypothetical protein